MRNPNRYYVPLILTAFCITGCSTLSKKDWDKKNVKTVVAEAKMVAQASTNAVVEVVRVLKTLQQAGLVSDKVMVESEHIYNKFCDVHKEFRDAIKILQDAQALGFEVVDPKELMNKRDLLWALVVELKALIPSEPTPQPTAPKTTI